MGDETMQKSRIMLTNCKRPIPEIENLCRRFGELSKDIHFPKHRNNICFVEYRNPENAQQAISSINANASLGMSASYATDRLPVNNSSRNTSQDRGNNYPQRYNRQQSRERGFNQGHHKKSQNHPQQTAHVPPEGYAHSSRSVVVKPPPVTAQRERSVNQGGMLMPTPVAAPARVEQVKSLIVGPCVKCGVPAENQCEICFDAYCGVECQRLDWGRHKRECRPPPSLIQPKKVTASSPSVAQQPQPYLPKPVQFLPMPAPVQVIQQVQLPPKVQHSHQASTNNSKPVQVLPLQTPPAPAPQPLMQVQVPPRVQHRVQSSSNRSKPDPKHAPFPKKGDHVIITSSPLPHVVYLQAVDRETCKELNEVLGRVANYAVNAPQLTRLPNKDTFVLAQLDGTWQRALVMSVSGDKKSAKVAYIDSGHTATIDWPNLKALEDYDLICAVRHNFRASLKDVLPRLKSKEMVELMQSVIISGDEFELHFDERLKVMGVREVELIRYRDQKSLNAEFSRLSAKKTEDHVYAPQPVAADPKPSTSAFKPASKPSPTVTEASTVVTAQAKVVNGHGPDKQGSPDDYVYGTKDLVMKGVPNGRNLRIFILDNELLEFGKVSGIFYNDKVNLPPIQTSVDKYCAGLSESYKPRKFELCLAKHDGDWYRGMSLMDTSPDGNFTIFFIDYGNFAEVAAADIRRISRDLVKMPVYTKMCWIKGLPEDCSSVLPMLQRMFPIGEDIIAETVENVIKISEDINDSYAEITIKNLAQIMKL